MDGLYSNGSVIRPAWLFNDGSRCESLKHFYIKFYDIYDGLVRLRKRRGGVRSVESERKRCEEALGCVV